MGGLFISRIHFKKGLPKVEEIRRQFKKQTGLDIWMKGDINLIELPSNNKRVIEELNKDSVKYELLIKETSKESREKIKKEEQKINHISDFYFYTQFYGLWFYIEGKTIQFVYEGGRFYFPKSLEKSLIDLGGEFVNQKNEPQNWQPPKSWKKLKLWSEYKWYNKPRK